MNQFQGPGPEREPISRDRNLFPRQDPAEVRPVREYLTAPGADPNWLSAEEDPDVEPFQVTEADEEWARDRVRQLLGGSPDW